MCTVLIVFLVIRLCHNESTSVLVGVEMRRTDVFKRPW